MAIPNYLVALANHKGNFNDVFHKWIPEEEKTEENEAVSKAFRGVRHD